MASITAATIAQKIAYLDSVVRRGLKSGTIADVMQAEKGEFVRSRSNAS
jgi:hypothetical protein